PGLGGADRSRRIDQTLDRAMWTGSGPEPAPTTGQQIEPGAGSWAASAEGNQPIARRRLHQAVPNVGVWSVDRVFGAFYGRLVAPTPFHHLPHQRNHMSEQAQPPQVQQVAEVVVDDSASSPTYSNFCRVTATPEEVILDFALNPQPFATGKHEVKANHR